MNPFSGTRAPISTMGELLYRIKAIEELEDRIATRKHTAILGVEGIGKTSLLNSFFNADYRIKKATDDRLLISPLTEFPEGLEGDAVIEHFIGMVISSVYVLRMCGQKDMMNDILDLCEKARDVNPSVEGKFEAVVNTIQTFGYRILMLVDNFERFTSSSGVTITHHSTLRKLMGATQYIVSTNYDLSHDSLPPKVSNSFYLMNFAGNDITLRGWSPNETSQYLNDALKNSDVEFSPEVIEKIHSVSGGIPPLVNKAAAYAYDFLLEGNAENDLKLKEVADDPQVQKYFHHWCRMLTEEHILSLKNLYGEHNFGVKSCLVNQRNRGLLDYYTYVDENGKSRVNKECFVPCCRWLESFFRVEGNLENAAKENPLLKADNARTETATMSADNLSVEEILQKIKDGIKSDKSDSKGQLLSIVKGLMESLPNVTLPIDLSEELSDDVLGAYKLSKNYMSKLSPEVQNFIYTGIQMDRGFENINIPGFDYSPIYICFCKAVETHLNQTIVPIIKEWAPDTTDNKGKTVSENPAGKEYELGVLHTMLIKRQSGINPSALDILKTKCKAKGLSQHPDNWWDSLADAIKEISIYRNGCPHCSPLKDNTGKHMLAALFVGPQNNPNKSFMMKCTNVYNSFLEVK